MHPKLRVVVNEALNTGLTDIAVIETARSVERQRQLIAEGKSSLDPMCSDFELALKAKHVVYEGVRDFADAVDLWVYPLDWDQSEAQCALAGLILALGRVQGVHIRWGGTWDRPFSEIGEDYFFDPAHFEIIK